MLNHLPMFKLLTILAVIVGLLVINLSTVIVLFRSRANQKVKGFFIGLWWLGEIALAYLLIDSILNIFDND